MQSIGGDASFCFSEVANLGQLQSIGRDAYFDHSPVQDLGQLQSVGHYVHIYSSKLKPEDFENVKHYRICSGKSWGK